MRHALALTLLCVLTFGGALGRSAITDSDEAYYAEAAREMVVSGDWTTPHYNFEPRLQKPVLFYWLIAGTYLAAGVSEFNARLWSALSGLGVAWVAFLVGRRWFGPGEGLLAGVIVATSFGVVPFARQALPDMPLAFFVSVSIWAAMEALAGTEAPRVSTGRDREPRGWAMLSAAAAALGMLDKGPVAVALPVVVLGPLLVWQAARTPGRWLPGLRASHLLLAVAVFLAIATPWYVAVMRAQGIDYARQFFIGENVERFATATYNQWRGWIYVPVIVSGLLPWSAFFLLWWRPFADVVSTRHVWTPIEVRLIAWALGPLLFFMASVGSQPRYILPCLVPIAILLARTIWRRAVAPVPAGGDWFRLAAVLAGGLMVLAAALLWRAASIFRAGGADVSVVGPQLMLVTGLAAVAALAVLPRPRLPWVVAAAAAVSLTVFAGTLLSPVRPEPAEVIGQRLRSEPADVLVCSCGAFARSLNFYAERPVVIANVSPEDPTELLSVLDSPGRALAAVDARTLAVIERDGRRFPRLAEVTYLNSSVWQRGETLVRPDRSWVQRVVLIANR